MTATKPLLLLDVDGPLNPFKLLTKRGQLPLVYERHVLDASIWPEGAGVPFLVAPEHGAHMRAVAEHFTLVWATTWEERANEILGPLLGLPRLPVIEWPETARDWTLGHGGHRGSWKTKWIAPWLDQHAAYRDADGQVVRIPWVWVDDEITPHDRAWLRQYYGEPGRATTAVMRWLLRIEPMHGLRRSDFAALAAWARDVAGPTVRDSRGHSSP